MCSIIRRRIRHAATVDVGILLTAILGFCDPPPRLFRLRFGELVGVVPSVMGVPPSASSSSSSPLAARRPVRGGTTIMSDGVGWAVRIANGHVDGSRGGV